MNDDIPREVKIEIIEREISAILQQIYRLSVSCEARKIAGYSEEENRQFIIEIERLVKLRDAMTTKLTEVRSLHN